MNKNASITTTVDTNYKGGFIRCEECGWSHTLGDGFNQHYLESCPNCDDSITTRIQDKVVYNDKQHSGLRADLGNNHYFAMSNGVHVRYKLGYICSHYNLTEGQANRL